MRLRLHAVLPGASLRCECTIVDPHGGRGLHSAPSVAAPTSRPGPLIPAVVDARQRNLMAAEFYGKEYVLFEGGLLNNAEGEGVRGSSSAAQCCCGAAGAACMATGSSRRPPGTWMQFGCNLLPWHCVRYAPLLAQLPALLGKASSSAAFVALPLIDSATISITVAQVPPPTWPTSWPAWMAPSSAPSSST